MGRFVHRLRQDRPSTNVGWMGRNMTTHLTTIRELALYPAPVPFRWIMEAEYRLSLSCFEYAVSPAKDRVTPHPSEATHNVH